ncbi:N-acetyltransferase [Streptomyces sp. PD-S100-1]|uniref:N-acetyltransferase n=1 Tax=Streptomyces sp. PD-S100-1 TaxID=3394351 RepID=UPI0039BD6F53
MGTAGEYRIAALGAEHPRQVLTACQLGVDEGNAAFEATAPPWEEFDAAELPQHRHVALDDSGRVLGRVAAVPVSGGRAFAAVPERRPVRSVRPAGRPRNRRWSTSAANVPGVPSATVFQRGPGEENGPQAAP